jgi:predicted transcriptional regulator
MPDGTNSPPISLRVPADVIEALDKIATILDRPRSWVMLRALRRYLSEEGQEILDVQEGIVELDRGEGMPFADVLAEIDEAIVEAQAKHAAG